MEVEVAAKLLQDTTTITNDYQNVIIPFVPDLVVTSQK